jgi:hypothetical protein
MKHLRGLALLGSCSGLAFACSGGLEHGLSHANELGAGRTDDGCVPKKTQRLGDHSFGSGQPIWQR